jgi:HlyD family secretion protein
MTQSFARSQEGEVLLADHTREGIAILTARPSPLFRATLSTLFLLLLAGIGWSFFGHADVIVRAPGQLGLESEERLVYAPIDGQLVNLYVAEGTPIVQGDVLARINSATALQRASQLRAAELKLKVAEQHYNASPLRREAIEQYIKTNQFQIDSAERAHKLRRTEWLEKLAEEQHIKLEKARLKLTTAEQEMGSAQQDWQKYQRLFKSADGGGIARSKVEEKRREYQSKQIEYQTAKNELAEFEVKLNQEYAQKKKEIDSDKEQLLSLYAQLAERKVSLANNEIQTLAQLEVARAEVAGLKKITFNDIDEDNMLRVKAPVSGVVTRVFTMQPGANIDDKMPFVGIAPTDARTVLQLEIPEQERALLKEEMAVKIKFNAFPYQRYGFIGGTLEFIAPSATFSGNNEEQNRKLVFKARVSMDRLHFTMPGEKVDVPLRYGMTAIAEIVVRQRRLIDLFLDPFRQAVG